MDNRKFIYVKNVLEAIDEHLSNGTPLHPGALLLEGEKTIAEAVDIAVGFMKSPTTPPEGDFRG